MDDLRGKVIRGMECMVQISGKGCKECKYTKECDGSIATMYAGTVQMTIDALSLLKAQEPHVMTPEEVEKVGQGSKEFLLFCRVADALDAIPSVPAVPLDKLCEWLAERYAVPCRAFDEPEKLFCDQCYEEGISNVECWKRYMIKWMEGLDDKQTV